MKTALILVFILIVCIMTMTIALSCKKADVAKETDHVKGRVSPPEWSHAANHYDVNIRQYTPEGTLEAIRQHLPRLKTKGIDILCLLTIHIKRVQEHKRKKGN